MQDQKRKIFIFDKYPLNIAFLYSVVLAVLLGGCGGMPRAGASKTEIQHVEEAKTMEGVVLTKVDDTLAKKIRDGKKHPLFSQVFTNKNETSYNIQPGDTLAVSIWESQPSLLFTSQSTEAGAGIALGPSVGSTMVALPPQMVMDDEKIGIPFLGRIAVAGKTPYTVEKEICKLLSKKANNPQVIVSIVKNPSSQISILGDVNKNMSFSLSPKRERLLDALAQAGGVSQPVTKMSIQLSRREKTAVMPLDTIVKNPKQNIPLLPGDIVTALFQPWTFSVLGATGQNKEVPFEATGISLAQALARSGGLNDNRADPAGVFVFRFEDVNVIPPEKLRTPINETGKIPVVYQIDFSDPTAFLATQNFPMQDKDVVYVANMPSAELAKFLRMIGMVASPTMSILKYDQSLY